MLELLKELLKLLSSCIVIVYFILRFFNASDTTIIIIYILATIGFYFNYKDMDERKKKIFNKWCIIFLLGIFLLAYIIADFGQYLGNINAIK